MVKLNKFVDMYLDVGYIVLNEFSASTSGFKAANVRR